MKEYNVSPVGIENNSMDIIESEMDNLEKFSKDELKIVKRMIHTTADFEYSKLVVFSEEVIDICKKLLKSGCKIYSDTEMIKVGVNRLNLKHFGCEVCNYVHDDDVRNIAKQRGITRSMAAIEKAYNDKEIGIYMIGNAPTALYRLMELIEANEDRVIPVIIGVPVGFVGAAESKEKLIAHDGNIPQIVVRGRKGGSTVAVSIVNAILKMCREE